MGEPPCCTPENSNEILDSSIDGQTSPADGHLWTQAGSAVIDGHAIDEHDHLWAKTAPGSIDGQPTDELGHLWKTPENTPENGHVPPIDGHAPVEVPAGAVQRHQPCATADCPRLVGVGTDYCAACEQDMLDAAATAREVS
jgi:hypothetical protein